MTKYLLSYHGGDQPSSKEEGREGHQVVDGLDGQPG